MMKLTCGVEVVGQCESRSGRDFVHFVLTVTVKRSPRNHLRCTFVRRIGPVELDFVASAVSDS